MIPLAELPSADGVYVLHLSQPLAHAHGYVGWSTDIARRVAEHLDVEACRAAGFHIPSHRGSPLIRAAASRGARNYSSRRTGMRDREWLLIALGALVIVLGTTIAALCTAGVLPVPDDPAEPEIEQVVSAHDRPASRRHDSW